MESKKLRIQGNDYITQSTASHGHPGVRNGEQMEPVPPRRSIFGEDTAACKSAAGIRPVLIGYKQEEVSYMADYEIDENREIVAIRYDSVSEVREKGHYLILMKGVESQKEILPFPVRKN